MSSNKTQEVIFDYRKHELDKEKRTKKKGLKGNRKNEASEDAMVSKKKAPSKKKNKYINYKNIDVDIFDDDFDDYIDY